MAKRFFSVCVGGGAGKALIAVSLLVVTGCRDEQSAWRDATDRDTQPAYHQFLSDYPSSPNAAQAKINLFALEIQAAENADTVDGYRAFLKSHTLEFLDDSSFESFIPLLEAVQARAPECALTAFSLGLAFYRTGDLEKMRLHVSSVVDHPKRLQKLGAWAAAILGDDPQRPWREFFAAAVAESRGDLPAAIEHYENATKLDPAERLFQYGLWSAKTRKSKGGADLEYAVKVGGPMGMAPGRWGSALPLRGKTTVTGKILSSLGELKFEAQVKDWDYLFKDQSREYIVGWGLVAGEGNVLLSREVAEALKSGGTPFFATQEFELRPFDLFEKQVLAVLDPGAGSRLVLPKERFPFSVSADSYVD